jgi:hypothetical protein
MFFFRQMGSIGNESHSALIWTKLSSLAWGISDLAKATNLNPGYVTLIINGWSESPRARRKIEACLRSPIWCTSEEFRERLPGIDLYGCDFHTMAIDALTLLCNKFHLLSNRSTGLRRAFLINLLTERCKQPQSPVTERPDNRHFIT